MPDCDSSRTASAGSRCRVSGTRALVSRGVRGRKPTSYPRWIWHLSFLDRVTDCLSGKFLSPAFECEPAVGATHRPARHHQSSHRIAAHFGGRLPDAAGPGSSWAAKHTVQRSGPVRYSTRIQVSGRRRTDLGYPAPGAQHAVQIERSVGSFVVSAGYDFSRVAHLPRSRDHNLYLGRDSPRRQSCVRPVRPVD